MAIIYLVRHGQNDMVGKRLAGRLPGVHLNTQGKAQADRLAAELEALPIKAVFASPLERAQETAEPIALRHALSVEVMSALLEIDFGKWEGKRLKALKHGRLWKVVQGSPQDFRFPEGESFLEAQQRICKGLVEISDTFKERDQIVCVGHSDMIRLAIAYFLGLPLENFQRIRIATASISVLNLHDGLAFFGPINLTFDFSKNND